MFGEVMPFIVKQTEQPQPQVVTQNEPIDPFVGLYVLLALVVAFLFKDFIKDLFIFTIKIGVLAVFGFISYTLFLT
jgi:hypothetical protein